MIHHITRATRHLIFWSLISAAIGLTGIRLLLSGIEHYKSDLAAHISAAVGTPVTIGRLGATMRGFNPQLVLSDIAIASIPSTGNEKSAIEFNQIRLGVNLLDMLTSRDVLSSSWVALVGAKLSVKRQLDGSIAIVGLKTSDGQPQWLLQGRRYEVLQSDIIWQDDISHSKPLLFKGVDLAILNDGERHRLNMLIKLPEKVGHSLRVSMDFNGNIFEPASIQGRVYINGEGVSLPEVAVLGLPFFQASVEDRIRINTGVGDFEIWGDWRQSQLASMDVAAHIQETRLVRQGQPEFFVKQLKTRLHWAVDDTVNDASNHQWRLDVNDFSLETQNNPNEAVKKWPAATFSVSAQRANDNVLHNLALFVERVDLQEASGLAQFFAPLPDEQAKLLTQAQLKGTLEKVSLFADLDSKSVALNGSFTGVGVAPLFSVPGIENLTGQIKGDEKQGTIILATQDAWLSAPGLLREVLPVKRLQGALEWRQAAEHNWSLSSQMIELDSLRFQSQTRFRVDIPDADKPVFMDLQTSFVGEDASEVKHYLPVGIMHKEVVAWLDRAFVGGKMSNGGVLVYGNLVDFPFTTAPGVFEALFDAEQFDLSYDPEWPDITELDAEVMFLQGGLKVDIRRGQSGNVTIKQASCVIPSLNASKHLLIQGEAEAGIDQVLAFMQHTPLSSPVNSLLEAITPQGNSQVTLDLKIPLIDGAPTKVDGVAQLKDARLMVKSLELPVSKISGALKFNENGVYSDAINAAALGHPIQINIKNSESQTTVNVTGSAGISDLQTQFAMPWWKIAEGTTDYQLKLELPYGDAAPELFVDSALSGVSLDLSDSLGKTKEQKIPLSMTFNLGDDKSGAAADDGRLLPVLLNYGNKLKAAIQLDTRQKTIHSGYVLVGEGEVAQTQDVGLKLEINRERLELYDWLGLAASQGASDGVKELRIHSNHALWKQTDLGAFDLALKRNGQYWAGAIAAAIAKGKVQIPVDFKGTDRINLDMDMLDFSILKQIGSKDSVHPAQAGLSASVQNTVSPELAPLLTLTSHKTLWRSIDLGRLSVQTERIPGGMDFKRVELVGDNQKLVLSGDWRLVSAGQTTTHSQGRLEVPRVGQLLAQLDISKDLTETGASVDFSVDWNAAPYQFALADLKGQLDVDFKSGRILSIEPGFGRILGMLALAQWIKRAQLDFSDIYQEGLTFNSIKGHFDLAGGIASTHDLLVDAVPANITISGETDFVKQTVDHIVNVVPKSADAVPIAGTIMGKVAALVGRSLTGKDQQGFFFGSQYLVKGVWGSAQIIPMHKNDGLLQKTWNGITGFPWIQQEETTKQLEK